MAKTRDEIEEWLKKQLGELLEVEGGELDLDLPLVRYGLDSSAALALTEELSNWLGVELDATLLYDHPSISAVVRHLGAR